MIAEAQEILSKSGSTIKVLASSHPIALGVVIGVGAYYVVNKFWLNEDEEVDAAEEAESTEEGAGATT